MRATVTPTSRTLSLYIPDLLMGLRFLKDIPKQNIPQLAVLQLLLTRALKLHHDFEDYYQAVCVLSGIDITECDDTPLAAITSAVDPNNGIDTNELSYYIYAEPVIMRADRDNVVLIDSLHNNFEISAEQLLSVDESEQLIEEINCHFNNEPWILQLAANGSWIVKLDSKFNIRTTVLSTVILKNTLAYIARGEDERYWRKIMTEIEMLLYSSPVNRRRTEQNKYSVTSLWLWAGGRIPAIYDAAIDLIATDSKFLNKLSEFVNVAFKPIENETTLHDIINNNYSRVIIVNSLLSSSWRQQNLNDWFIGLQQMESNFFEPVIDCLLKKQFDCVDLYLDDFVLLKLTRRNVKAWWKFSKSLRQLSHLYQ